MSYPVEDLLDRLSELYVGLEDLKEEDSPENLLKALILLCDLRMSMEVFEKSAVAVLGIHSVPWSEMEAKLGETLEGVLQRFQSAEGRFDAAEQSLAALLATR